MNDSLKCYKTNYTVLRTLYDFKAVIYSIDLKQKRFMPVNP